MKLNTMKKIIGNAFNYRFNYVGKNAQKEMQRPALGVVPVDAKTGTVTAAAPHLQKH